MMYAANPLDRLEFVAGVIDSLCNYSETEDIEVSSALGMANVIHNAVEELYALVNILDEMIDERDDRIKSLIEHVDFYSEKLQDLKDVVHDGKGGEK